MREIIASSAIATPESHERFLLMLKDGAKLAWLLLRLSIDMMKLRRIELRRQKLRRDLLELAA